MPSSRHPTRRPTRSHSTNRILSALPADELGRLAPHFETVDLVYGEVLCHVGEKIRHAIFPDSGIVSLLAPVDDAVDGAAMLEVGLVGREGVFGLSLALGINVSPVRAVGQGKGSALRIKAVEFGRALNDCPTLRHDLHRYTYDLMRQITQTAVCNSFHPVQARTARWLLSTGDRMQSDRFVLTQAFLADMLGVQRGAVTRATSALQTEGLIDYSRGDVAILDRPGLEAAACGCYRIADGIYRAGLR